MDKNNDLVLDALAKAIRQEGECRLVAKGKSNPGLLPGGRQTKATQTAIAQSLDENLGLFEVYPVEEGSGKSKKTAYFVKLAKPGIDVLFRDTPETQQKHLLEEVSPTYRQLAEEACLQNVAKKLGVYEAQQEQLSKKQNELFGFAKTILDEQNSRIHKERDQLEKRLVILREIQALIQSAPQQPFTVESHTAKPQPERPVERAVATGESELDFQRDVCEELVYSWQDAESEAVRDSLERVMFNNGLEQVGKAGEHVEFNGRQHVTDDPLKPGDDA